MTVKLITRPCVLCGNLAVEYETDDAVRLPRSVRAVFPRIGQKARICDRCDNAQHRPSEVRRIIDANTLRSLENLARR